ncbi:hypothetical protein [Glutamicibacter nicotianae]|uniref:hypothetical protein n=1 Tax=Glutamicibacter nicotianae TaxID=37929 RepID=UPI00307AC712
MATEEIGPNETIIRFYRINRIPHLYGKVNGEKIWGGPYTGYQIIFAVIAVIIGFNTIGYWGNFGVFGNIIVLIVGVYAASWVGQWISMNVNDPLVAVTGLGTMLGSPEAGSIDGKKIERKAKVQKWAGRNFDQDLTALYADSPAEGEYADFEAEDPESIDDLGSIEELAEAEELATPAVEIHHQSNVQVKAAANLTAVERLLGMTERSTDDER